MDSKSQGRVYFLDLGLVTYPNVNGRILSCLADGSDLRELLTGMKSFPDGLAGTAMSRLAGLGCALGLELLASLVQRVGVADGASARLSKIAIQLQDESLLFLACFDNLVDRRRVKTYGIYYASSVHTRFRYISGVMLPVLRGLDL